MPSLILIRGRLRRPKK